MVVNAQEVSRITVKINEQWKHRKWFLMAKVPSSRVSFMSKLLDFEMNIINSLKIGNVFGTIFLYILGNSCRMLKLLESLI